jgi:vacuolar protein sorting-associated protein 35
LNNALDHETNFGTPEDVDLLLQIISPLIVDPSDKPDDYEQDNEDFVEEQTLIARLIHLMYSESLDQQFLVSLFIFISLL